MDRFSELKAFTLVASAGGFSAAARHLGVATSSVTRLVDALERRIGAPLLNRSTRQVTLTDAGQAYFDQATQILEALNAADEAAAGRDGEPHGLLRVAAPVTFCTLYVAPMLGDFGRRYPRIEVELNLNDAVSNLVDESIDVAIRIGATEHVPNLIARKLADHERIICASPSYLEQFGVPTAATELLSHKCLQFAYSGGKRSWRLQSGENLEEVHVRGPLSINNSAVLRQAAIDGAGIAMLPDWLVGKDLHSGALQRVLDGYIANPGSMDVGLFAIYQANRRGSSKVKAFVDMLEQELTVRLNKEG